MSAITTIASALARAESAACELAAPRRFSRLTPSSSLKRLASVALCLCLFALGLAGLLGLLGRLVRIAAVGGCRGTRLRACRARLLLLDPLDHPHRQVGGQLGVGDEGHRRDPFAVVDLVLDQATGGAGGVELCFAEAQHRILGVVPAVGGAVAIAELAALFGVADHLAEPDCARIDQGRRVLEAAF